MRVSILLFGHKLTAMKLSDDPGTFEIDLIADEVSLDTLNAIAAHYGTHEIEISTDNEGDLYVDVKHATQNNPFAEDYGCGCGPSDANHWNVCPKRSHK
jgi:hypothetical protein